MGRELSLSQHLQVSELAVVHLVGAHRQVQNEWMSTELYISICFFHYKQVKKIKTHLAVSFTDPSFILHLPAIVI